MAIKISVDFTLEELETVLMSMKLVLDERGTPGAHWDMDRDIVARLTRAADELEAAK